MTAPSGDDRPPLAVAMEWVAVITTVVAEMVLPGIAGAWLDARWGTGFIGLAGFALGMAIGIRHLVSLSNSRTQTTKRAGQESQPRTDSRAQPDCQPQTEDKRPQDSPSHADEQKT